MPNWLIRTGDWLTRQHFVDRWVLIIPPLATFALGALLF